MSLLDNKAQSELLSRIAGNNEAKQQEQPSPSLETNNTVQAEVVNTTGDNREPPSQAEHKVDQQSIPYDRFKKVNDSKKEYQKKYEEQQKEIEKLRKELETKSSTQGDNWLDELLQDDNTPDNKKLSSLEQRLQSFELKEAERELGNIVKDAVKRHNDLDSELVESVVYQAISENPDADVDDAIDRMREFIAYVNNRGIKKPQVQTQAPQTKVPPRPSMTANKQYTEQANKPKNLADAKDALYNFLKNNKL